MRIAQNILIAQVLTYSKTDVFRYWIEYSADVPIDGVLCTGHCTDKIHPIFVVHEVIDGYFRLRSIEDQDVA